MPFSKGVSSLDLWPRRANDAVFFYALFFQAFSRLLFCCERHNGQEPASNIDKIPGKFRQIKR